MFYGDIGAIVCIFSGHRFLRDDKTPTDKRHPHVAHGLVGSPPDAHQRHILLPAQIPGEAVPSANARRQSCLG